MTACRRRPCTLSCGAGTTRCDDFCVDTEVDPRNCGACNTRCDALAACIDGECTCADGYQGYGRDCTDIDECKGGNACSPSGECINVEGSYACSCFESQSGDGETCTGMVLVTRSMWGDSSFGDLGRLRLSKSGRYVAFSSTSHDLVSPVTTLVSINPDGDACTSGNNQRDPINPSLSDDGNLVAFESGCRDLVGTDTHDFRDIFVRDLTKKTTRKVSVDLAGGESGGNSFSPQISADGRYVAFWSEANDLVAGDTNGKPDVFVRDLIDNVTTRVSLNASGGQIGDGAAEFGFARSGAAIAFVTKDSLLPEDSNATASIYLRYLR